MGADSAKGSKGRLGVQPLGVVSPGDQESDGAVRADAHRFEQPRGMEFDEPGQVLVQLVDLSGELLDALGEHAQGHAGGLGHRVLVSPTAGWAEARAGVERLGVTEARHAFPQGGVGDDQDGLELVDRLGAGLGRGALGELEDPGAVHRTIAGLAPSPGTTAEHGSRCGPRIERVRLCRADGGPTGRAGSPRTPRSAGPAGSGRGPSESARTLHARPANRPPLAYPDEQLSVTGRRRRKGLGSRDLPERGDHGGDMHLAVRVHSQDDLAPNRRIRA